MLKKLNSLSNLTKVLVIAVVALMAVSCSKDDNPMTSQDSNKFAGSYISNYRWGGAEGTWRGSTVLNITNKGEVTYGGSKINKPTFTDSTLSWKMADGNKTNAGMSFSTYDDNSFYWNDKGEVKKANFTGFIQNPGEGPLDFRALKDN